MKRFVPVQARGDAPIVPLAIDQALVVLARPCETCKGEAFITRPFDPAKVQQGRLEITKPGGMVEVRCPDCADSLIPGAQIEISPLELFLAATVKPDALLPEDGSGG